MKRTESELNCTQCHHFVLVEGKPACTNIAQKPGKQSYKFLKSLKPCEKFWKAKK